MLEKIMSDEDFKLFLALPRHMSLHSVEKSQPKESTLQLVKTAQALVDATAALVHSSKVQESTREAIHSLIDVIQRLMEDKAGLQVLERQALNGLLKELGLSG